jgi:hypothetical protein
MPVSDNLKKLVDDLPKPDGAGMYCDNPNKEKIETAVAAIQKGGRESYIGLIDMLLPQGQGDGKAHYALHCVGNYTLIIKDENARKEFSQALADQLGSDRTKEVKAYLCQELQWAGHGEAAPALGKLLNDQDLSAAAAMALVGIRDGAAEQLRAALPNAQGICRLNIVQALGAVGDTQSVAALRQALTDTDREVRLAAGWGLSRMGDAGSAEALMKAADAEPGWERIQATKHCLVLAEKLAASNNAGANAIYDYLRRTRTDPSEAYIVAAVEGAAASK